jgi:hypothetical protein
MYYEPSTEREFPTLPAFRAAYPNTSFGDFASEDEINAVGLYSIVDVRPNYDAELQQINYVGIALVDNKWTRLYTVQPLPLTPEEYMQVMVRRFDSALTAHLDATAQARRYDNRITCAVRAGYPGPFQAEGEAFALWMDTCNAYAYQLLAEVSQGVRPAPESPEAFIAELPPMEWPT